MPQAAYYAARNRYRADSLIRMLSDATPKDHVTLAITTRSISCTNGKYADWGIMGLSYCPGKACVASTFRLKKKNIREQFFKIAIHELGHTQGLDHCPGKSCFMRAFRGKDITSELTSFCPECKKRLKGKGWSL